MNRAYSLITVTRAVDDVSNKRRQFSGVATTPELDRVSDTIDPLGAKFKNPLALLRAHDSDCPIGKVTFKKPTAKGIEFDAEIPMVDEPGLLKDRLDMAWGEIKSGIVSAVSIGFRPMKYAFKEDGGIEFQEIEIYELSTVAVPANAGAVITSVKSIDRELRRAAGVPEPETIKNPNDRDSAASGQKQFATVRLITPPASGNSKTVTKPQEGKNVKISEKIARFEEKRAANTARIAAIHEETDESLNDAQLEEIKGLEAEIATIDRDLPSLKRVEADLAKGAKPVVRTVDVGHNGGPPLEPMVSVKAPPKLGPGIEYARLVMAKSSSRLIGEPPLVCARKMFGENSSTVGIITKANEVVPGSTISGTWAVDLISPEGAAVAAFLEYLRPQTVVGKFGAGNIPGLTRLDFYKPYVIQTGGGAAYWVGEGKPKPLTSFDFDRSTLTPLKIANIVVLTKENIQYSSPNSDAIVRDELAKAIIAGVDVAFIDPANAGTATVKPASITNGASTIVSTGDDADHIRLDVRAVFQKFITANNAPAQGVWIMSATNALALSLMVNTLGQPEFPGIGMNGGIFMGLPAIVSQSIGNVVVLVAADQIFLGDQGGVTVDMSTEASLEMKSASLTQDGAAGTGTSLVSMFQNNMVAFLAERTINWKRARASAVAYLTSADWGGAVPAS